MHIKDFQKLIFLVLLKNPLSFINNQEILNRIKIFRFCQVNDLKECWNTIAHENLLNLMKVGVLTITKEVGY